MKIENIVYNKRVIAMIITKSNLNNRKKYFFPTLKYFPLQVGFMNHKKGFDIRPHYHNKNVRKIKTISEVLLVKKGILRVDFYGNVNKYLFSKFIHKNDILILLSSGHGFKVIKDCSLIEIKQGPYIKTKDKKHFVKIQEKNIIVK
jgi:hypothetical protein